MFFLVRGADAVRAGAFKLAEKIRIIHLTVMSQPGSRANNKNVCACVWRPKGCDVARREVSNGGGFAVRVCVSVGYTAVVLYVVHRRDDFHEYNTHRIDHGPQIHLFPAL